MDIFYDIGSVSIKLLETIINTLDDSDLVSLLQINKWQSLLELISDKYWQNRGALKELTFPLISPSYGRICFRQVLFNNVIHNHLEV